jgi:hypothetical protein
MAIDMARPNEIGKCSQFIGFKSGLTPSVVELAA